MSLAVQRSGRGPDLVLVHGWGLESGVWAPLLEPLGRQFRLHCIDLPGHGGSPLTGEFEFDAVVGALLEAAPAGAAWLGWSLGGMLALGAALAAPERVDRLLLVASSPRFVADADWPHAMQPEVLAGFGRDLATERTATLRRFLSLVARGAPDAGVLRALRRRLVEAPAPVPAALAGGLAILAGCDLRSALTRLEVPLAALFGGRDALVPAGVAGDLARLCPALRVQSLPAAGHAPFLSHPGEFVAAAAALLA
ncbi:pimeloyl-ACP methyl ester esterase BioH [Thiohalobacter sp. IOR34]|uniref:pimeloyl-ACP methyl ester esterase BioH n=1 Tax=Thiohalobacter sp. IOR34 TaxID=3057176 RepID=UPI0025B10CED|nr:pimeloyl-ACP methyl ester esterase BioH [Thiohalobacter sp. IOR34]WJW75726.1 pimeloyl-ACP methyl ester esterase BioH [Thiohalobacter sp. IOR34]